MQAVFVHKNCVLRDSHIEPTSSPETWRLTPATLEGMRALADDETLILIWGGHVTEGGSVEGLDVLRKQIQAAGGRVDVLILCEHDAHVSCKCWGEFPGALWAAAAEFQLQLNRCYVLGDTLEDVKAAYAAGARPMLVLCGRSILQVLGTLPERSDFPMATDLTRAVGYINVEEEITQQLGHPRNAALPAPVQEILYADPGAMPTMRLTSNLAQAVQTRLRRSQVLLRDMVRWLTFFVLGALGLSLGIAYILTHLYRVQPFPEPVHWITLQFIPRPLRGALFIIWGIGVIALTIRSFYGSMTLRLWTKHRS